MHKTIILKIRELRRDCDSAMAMLNHACNDREVKYRVRGMTSFADELFLYLLPREAGEVAETYVFAPWKEDSRDGLVASLRERWMSGFDLVGSVGVEPGEQLMLFAHLKRDGE